VKDEEIKREDKKYNKMSGGKEECEIAKAGAIERSIGGGKLTSFF
jgi:hypothetical protein